jgi:hypothetical protein
MLSKDQAIGGVKLLALLICFLFLATMVFAATVEVIDLSLSALVVPSCPWLTLYWLLLFTCVMSISM